MSDPTIEPVADASEPLPEPPAPEAAHGSHRLWALLLVLDSAFVIVFGGLVASKVYQHWNEPAPAPAPAAHRRATKPSDAAKAAEPAPAPAPETAAKPPEPAPAPAPVPAEPPKPSLAEEKPAAAPTPAPAADGRVKAAPVEFKIKAPKAASVQIVGAFIVHGGRKEMTRRSDGTWTVKLYLNPGQYRYFFFIDGRRTLDPANTQSDRGASLLTLP